MTDREHYFHGHEPRECGFHDSTGDRAWCSDCTEWCYEAMPCRGCELPSLRAEVERLTDDRNVTYGALLTARRRAEAAEAEVESLRHHERLLAAAIVQIAEALGAEIDTGLTGPEVLLLAEQTAEEARNVIAEAGS